jgi:hypothetical protein
MNLNGFKFWLSTSFGFTGALLNVVLFHPDSKTDDRLGLKVFSIFPLFVRSKNIFLSNLESNSIIASGNDYDLVINQRLVSKSCFLGVSTKERVHTVILYLACTNRFLETGSELAG